MGILSANNNIAYTTNNACKIYIIKQIDRNKQEEFESDYADLIYNSKSNIKLVPLITNKPSNYKYIQVQIKPECPDAFFLQKNKEGTYDSIPLGEDYIAQPNYTFNHEENKSYSSAIYKYTGGGVYFLVDLLELRNCPLLDFSKLSYVFQIENGSKGGLADVISFNTTFSVNGQSSCDISLNNQNYKYNFKYFNQPEMFNKHLKCYFDTNDIIIVRMQKKNTTPTSLLNSFKSSVTDYMDIYKSSENDTLTTIFTGYINDVNESFSYETGIQGLEIKCTGPSKKLTWTRVLQNKAMASADSGDAVTPVSAYFTGAMTSNENGKTTINNAEVIRNLIVRTYSGVNNIPEVVLAKQEYEKNFDKNINKQNDAKVREIEAKIQAAIDRKDHKAEMLLRNELKGYNDSLTKTIAKYKKDYNDAINKNFKFFTKEEDGVYYVYLNTFIQEDNHWNQQPIFVINGTDQPAYKWQFANFSELFQSNFSTVYQFIKGIADNLLFNFYDDPYGIIHFGVPDITLQHLQRNDNKLQLGTDYNVLTQITNFSQSQNTESIANIQTTTADYIYDVPLTMITTAVKDYDSIAKYGEKLMQPLQITGITDKIALRYASKMRMKKNNRKALANIRVQMQGEPNLRMDKYAYIKELRKLFYVESYSHSYQAGGNFTTSLNGTYLRDILMPIENVPNDDSKVMNSKGKFVSPLENNLQLNPTILARDQFNKKLALCDTNEAINNILEKIDFTISLPSTLQKIYECYQIYYHWPKDVPELFEEIKGLYSDDTNSFNIIRNCILDGFLWAIPFDVNPYSIAKKIQDEERKKLALLASTYIEKVNVKRRVSNANTQQAKSSEPVKFIDNNGNITINTIENIKSQVFGDIDKYSIIKNIPKYDLYPKLVIKAADK